MMRPHWFQRIVRKLDKTLAAAFYLDQWVIMTAPDMDFRSLDWQGLTPLVPPKDRYWGDPFIIRKADRYYVFIEEKLYATGRGHIACLTLDADGTLLSQEVVLERGYHMSYPFLFEHQGSLFMMPETAANRTIEVYCCTHFPDRWEFSRTLMRDLYAVDATLLQHDGRYWLFANLRERGGSSLNTLHLFWAESPLADFWTVHPRNPVVQDLASARPAGSIFLEGGQLVRPAQDSSRRYGGSLRFNRITTLTQEEYGEATIARFAASIPSVRATHTFNQAGGLTVIDAVLRRPK
jgi:hypothetical protein